MITEIDYALMAGASYISSRPDVNKFPIPNGWVGANYKNPPNGGGFEAISFIHSGSTLANSTEIVISIAGTNGSGDMGTNVALWLGMAAGQLKEAAAYYLSVKAANPDAVISFTGHSMGGGLASLLGAFFGEKAVTFDQAPFASVATAANAQIIKDYLATLPNGGFVAGAAGNTLAVNNALAKLDAFINAADPMQTLADRVANISNIYVQGEVLSTAPFGSTGKLVGGTPTQLDQTSITMQPFGLSSGDLHSQALLTAFLQSPSFEAATAKLPDLLPLIFDGKMYMRNTGTNQQNFLEMLVQSEAATPSGSMLDRFAADMALLGSKQDWPSIISNINQGNLGRALMAFAMQMYYENTAIPADKTLFGDVTGGVQFDMQDVAATPTATKGYVQYFKSYLNILSNSERVIVEQFLPSMRDWYIQAGATAMNATDTYNRNAFMFGGTGGDTLTGGTGNDLLAGNGGTDTLTGGAGDDQLLGGAADDTLDGGAGDDTYTLEGRDTIRDSDGKGIIKDKAGNQLSGIIKKQTDGTYTYLPDPGISVTLDANLTLTKADGTVAVIENFRDGDLGFYLLNQISNLAGAGVADRLVGGTGNDIIEGNGDADVLLGGTGNDILTRGTGNDLHVVKAANDFEWMVAA